MTTFFETERLTVKYLTESDRDLHHNLLQDLDVMRFIGDGQPRSRSETDEQFAKLLEHQTKYKITLGSVFLKSDGSYIGRGGLVYLAFDDSQPEVEVGYAFYPAYWGKGYATELTKAAIQWGFDHLEIAELCGITNPKHHASQRVLEKAGMQLVGEDLYMGKRVMKHVIAIPN